MKDFLVTYIKTNNQKVTARARGRNIEEVQSFFNRISPEVKIIRIKKVRSR
jgi:DNA-binding protein